MNQYNPVSSSNDFFFFILPSFLLQGMLKIGKEVVLEMKTGPCQYTT